VNLTIKQKKVQGRHHIQVSATPKTPGAEALLREFKAGVSDLEKKWQAHKASQAAGKKVSKKAGKKATKKASKKA
jgi:hypothetical protein